MSIIKGTNQIVAGFGGTKRCIGEVYFSQSSLATDNPGALPGWTGEYYENGKTLFPDLYNFVKAHSELQVTKAQYDSVIATYGECPKYVVDENSGTTTGTITVYGWLAKGSTFYTKARNPIAGDSVWTSTDTTQETDYTVISLSNDTLTFSGPTREWSGTYSTTTTGTGIVTTSGTSLRLPKYANYIKMANSTEGIKNIEAGLPNIEGEFKGEYTILKKDNSTNSGAIKSVYSQNAGKYGASTANPEWGYGFVFDASNSNPIYGKSSTVTPASTTLYPWVVAYTAAIPASTAQAAQFQQGLSGKADTDLSNVSSTVKASLLDLLAMDTTRGVSLPSGTTLTQNGWIVCSFTDNNYGVAQFQLGGVTTFQWSFQSAANTRKGTCYGGKGQVFTITTSGTCTAVATFYPLKGD